MNTKKNKGSLNSSVSFFLAIKNLFFKKSMLLLIVLIISLGYLSMILAGGIILGLQETILATNIAFVTGNIIIEPSNDEQYISNSFEIEKKALAQREVFSVSPRLDEQVTLIDEEDNTLSSRITIVDPQKENSVSPIEESILIGEYLSKTSSEIEVLMESGYLQEYKEDGTADDGDSLDAKVGENIELLTTTGKLIDVKIVGIYQSNAFGGGKIYMSQDSAKKVFDFDTKDFDKSSSITIKTLTKGNEDEVVSNLKKLNIDAEINGWQNKLGGVEDFIGALLIIANFTAIFGVIVSFATVFIMIYINVVQKRSQIGIMKAVGINGNTILTSYVIQSVFYGIMGGVIGFSFTYAIVYYFALNPIIMPFGPVIPYITFQNYLTTFAILLVSSLIAGYLAARSVVHENILDAIFKG